MADSIPGEVQKADPPRRRQMLILLAVLSVLGAIGLAWFDAYFRELPDLARTSASEAAAKALFAGRLLFTILGCAILLAVAILGQISWRILKTGRFPPTGARVIRDTRVLHGRPAQLYGAVVGLLALLLLLTAVMIPWRAHRTLEALLAPRLQPTWQDPVDLGLD